MSYDTYALDSLHRGMSENRPRKRHVRLLQLLSGVEMLDWSVVIFMYGLSS